MPDEQGTRSTPPADTPDKAPQDGEKKVKQRGSPKFPGEGVISMRVESNPKRKGTACYDRFIYKNGMTVTEALAAGATYADLAWDTAHEFIAVNETAEMRAKYEAEAKEKEAAKVALAALKVAKAKEREEKREAKAKEKAEKATAREKAKVEAAAEKAKKAAEKKAAADAKAAQAAAASKDEGQGSRAQA